MDEPVVAFTKVSNAPKVTIKSISIELVEDEEEE